MTASFATFAINDATSQYDRWRAALDPDHVQPDGRSLEVLLQFAVQYAKLIRFYNLSDEPNGNWVEFFSSDSTMVLAALLGLDLNARESRYAELEAEISSDAAPERHIDALEEMFQIVLGLAHSLNTLHASGDVRPATKTGTEVNAQLSYLIGERLADPLRRAKSYADSAASADALGRRLELDFASLGPLWGLEQTEPVETTFAGDSVQSNAGHAVAHLRPVFEEFSDGIAQLQQKAATLFDQSLQEPGHRPQIGLYIAFAQLFATAQDTLNTFSQRYVNFYYRDILRETNAGPAPDSVYLAFTEDPSGTLPAPVPRGTLFGAGQDSAGNDILYTADSMINVSKASIAAVRTLRCVSGPLTLPSGNASAATCLQQVLASEIACPSTTFWPTFGPDAVNSDTVQATLGFAIASPYLLLNSGDRCVTLSFEFTTESLQLVDARLEAIEQQCGIKPEVVLRALLKNCFDIYMSTAIGWLKIEKYTVGMNVDTSAHPFHLDICFELNTRAASLAGYQADPEVKLDPTQVSMDPEVNATSPLPGAPTVKVYLRQAAVTIPSDNLAVRVYPLSVLAVFEVRNVGVQVKVKDMLGTLQNSFGPLDTSAAFPIFGTGTSTGSYVEVAEPELFVKVLEPKSLCAVIEWAGLPPQETGFQGYYKDYTIGLDGKTQLNLFDNQTFGGSISVTNAGLWAIEDDWPPGAPAPPANSSVYLFRTSKDCNAPVPAKDGRLCPCTTFDTFKVKPAEHKPEYYDPTQSTLRLTLTAPSYGFGEELYAINVLSSVVADLPSPLAGLVSGPVPVWGPLFEASQQLPAALEDCAKLPPVEWYDALTVALDAVMERLVLAFLGAFLQSLSQCPDLPPPYIFEAVQKIADTRIGLLPGAQARLLRDILGKPDGFLNGCARTAFDTCAVLLEAAAAIELSLLACPEPREQACVTAKVNEAALQIEQLYLDCTKKKVLAYPNTPWVPMASALHISYNAHCSFAVGAGNGDGHFFHLMPFDGVGTTTGAACASLFPIPEHEGSLMLGWNDFASVAPLSMLFEMQANGTAGLPAVAWQYLGRSGWTSYETPQISSDTTNGLRNTGVVALQSPAVEPGNPAIQPAECNWLRAIVSQKAGEFPGTRGIFPHSLRATRASTAGGETKTLPALTIESPVDALAGIASVLQPLPSFGGAPAEDDRAFFIRLGERLRHKDRAVLAWDYERLVLQAFPSIWKVKAIPHFPAPGSVLVAVVAGPNGVSTLDPTTPLVTADVLGAIQNYLARRASAFASIEVINPAFLRVQVTATIQFDSRDTTGGLLDRLNSDLIAHLSPWYYNDQHASLGGRYAESDAISTFITTRPYVVRLLEFACQRSPEKPSEPCYMLTSASQHVLTAAQR